MSSESIAILAIRVSRIHVVMYGRDAKPNSHELQGPFPEHSGTLTH